MRYISGFAAVLLIAASFSARPAEAQSVIGSPVTPAGGRAAGKMPTTFAPLGQSMAQLLDDGFQIVSLAGEDGEMVILRKSFPGQPGSKWVRCELAGGGQSKLIYSRSVSSDCRALN
ncbi:hypothetical protein [Acetobacter oeni]|uniref:Uncharacterized protein n=2 Tax=Acetobacter oeni TaxID=304077 RepID=A0A511XQN6_9PROT|nr:hypothetical protein [Acetobacter oeni]MBB3884859.1 hypothetical protein [Acetobacter oeni]NHO20723.1 hypothetical protein [Acetobacter oeni]GEN65278.1 hypothetical protein AOE01nite_35020 [Acetobacter oeni]